MISTWLLSICAGMSIGIIAENIAYYADFWRYHKTSGPLLNILCFFGILMGSVSMLEANIGLIGIFALGWIGGYFIEWLNFNVTGTFEFPNNRFLFARTEHSISITVAALWAAVPIGIVHLVEFLATSQIFN